VHARSGCMCGLHVPSSLFDWCDLGLKVGVVYTDENGWGGRVQLGDHLRRQKQLNRGKKIQISDIRKGWSTYNIIMIHLCVCSWCTVYKMFNIFTIHDSVHACKCFLPHSFRPCNQSPPPPTLVPACMYGSSPVLSATAVGSVLSPVQYSPPMQSHWPRTQTA
jgi:hypothetical protein